uniref:EGF-like domain-containing protein n=1 Tax=Heterorhabditis bacteriophora TaxID=37862 RepID=A0A1I7WBM1_HETBA
MNSLCLLPLLLSYSFAEDQFKTSPSTIYCKNGGMLSDGHCVCTLRYEGKHCEEERCLNGGRRHSANGQVKCHCPFGLSGERCERVTYCEPDKGLPKSCSGKLVNGKCECYQRWTGIFCQLRTCYNGIPTGGMVSESSLLAHTGSLSSRPFAWPIVLMGCAASLAVAALAATLTLAFRKWNAKPSRVSSAQGDREGTDV